MEKKIKVLHIVAGELNSGAARGALWLHEAQIEAGIDSKILMSGANNNDSSTIIALAKNPLQKFQFQIIAKIGQSLKYFYRRRKKIIFNSGFEGLDFKRYKFYDEADIIHLHWINGFVSTNAIRKIKKPVVWTVRDMWPLTGGCHYAIECNRHTTGCGNCPQLGSSSQFDLSRLVALSKRKFYKKDMRIVGISNWLSECIKNSYIFKDFLVNTIYNNIDTNAFSPIDKTLARKLIGIPNDKKIVLIGANSINDFYKGYDLFHEALKSIDIEKVHFLVFGKFNPKIDVDYNCGYTYLGYLSDNIAMRLAYSSADVFVAPSRMEAFGKTLIESMSCGTPVVCFDATGPKDIVEHKISGYKALPFDPVDLAVGIMWLLNQSNENYQNMCNEARKRAVEVFGSDVAAQKYKNLYLQILSK